MTPPTSMGSLELDAPVVGIGNARRKAFIQVLGAITYGELKAYDGAKANADASDNESDRRMYRKIAAEELRHHKGFSRRLVALGADVDRAMKPYESSLNSYHSGGSDDPVVEGVSGYLGEGIAADLLSWLKKVADPDTAAFIDTVIEDEVEHEALAAQRLRDLIDSDPGARKRAEAGVRSMLLRMAGSGASGGGPGPFGAFLRMGRPAELVALLVSGQARRVRAIGISPIRSQIPFSDVSVSSFFRPATRAFHAATSLMPPPLAGLARRAFPS